MVRLINRVYFGVRDLLFTRVQVRGDWEVVVWVRFGRIVEATYLRPYMRWCAA